uniref:Copia protein n=1 Tax=Culex pipiens TaxID=7175 RepID=A0A8D8KUH0_CULPI
MAADPKTGIARLNEGNWQVWKLRMDALLETEELWEVVEEEVPAAVEQDAAWKRKDRKARGMMIVALEDSQLRHIKGQVHAHDIYEALKAHHEKTTRSVRVSLLKKLCTLNLAEGDEIEAHLREFEELFDRLEAAGTSLDTDTQICMLLRSLPVSYDGVVTALDCLADDDISLQVVKARLEDEYNRQLERQGGDSKTEKAMRSTEGKRRKKPAVCYNCGEPGHFKVNCPELAEDQRKSAGGGNAKAKAAQSDARCVAFTTGVERNARWVIDSGASAHMTNDRSFFTSLSEFDGGGITLANGTKTAICGVGSGEVVGIDGEAQPVKISISEVKFVPGLTTSLISVGKLAEKDFSVVFDKKGCSIVSAGSKVVATGRRHGGLYYLRQEEVTAVSMVAAEHQHNADCLHQWHRRLGHHDWVLAKRIYEEELATGMKVTDCGRPLECACCKEGKSNHFPPHVLGRNSKRVLDVVHASVCGPMRTVTPSGNRFVLTMVDDFSRFTVTYMLKRKCEAASGIKEYVRWVESQFGRKPLVVRSDGGGVFNNTELRNFYKVEGIQPQFTTAKSGVAEQQNTSLTKMATCMLNDAGLDKRFWGEAMLTATYLQNRIPSKSSQGTPYELWWGRKPDLQHFRAFGSEAFVNAPERKLIFVGYAMDRKAYRFVDLDSDKITVSCDARFNELGDGSTTVEWPAETSLDEIELKPFVEKKEELKQEVGENSAGDEATDSNEEEFDEAGGDEGGPRPAQPRCLDDYEVEHAVEIAACAVAVAAGGTEAPVMDD